VMKIYGRSNATNVVPVLWTLEEIGAPYKRFNVGGSFGGVDSAAFRAMNPNGRIPVMDDDGFILWESNAIVRYLANAYGAGRILPASARERAVADQWMDWYKSTFYASYVALFQALIKFGSGPEDAGRIAGLVDALSDVLRVPDAALKRTDFLAGDAFSTGDIPLGAAIHRYMMLDITRPPLEGVEAWYSRLSQRPAYSATAMLPFGRSPAEFTAIEKAGAALLNGAPSDLAE